MYSINCLYSISLHAILLSRVVLSTPHPDLLKTRVGVRTINPTWGEVGCPKTRDGGQLGKPGTWKVLNVLPSLMILFALFSGPSEHLP